MLVYTMGYCKIFICLTNQNKENMITIKKIEGAFKTSYTLINDATNQSVGLVKGKNWLIKKQGWNLCNNPNYLTNHKNTGHYNKTTKCWFFDNDIENFMDEANQRMEIETTLRLNNNQ